LSLKGVVNKRDLRRRFEKDQIHRAVVTVMGTAPDAPVRRRGDMSRALYLWAMRRYSGLTLSEIGEACGGMGVSAVSVSIRRFTDAAESDRKLQALKTRVEEVLNVEP
jgi:hypothetical protein